MTSWSVMKTGLSLILSSQEFWSLSGAEIRYWRSFLVFGFVDNLICSRTLGMNISDHNISENMY